MRVRAYEIQTCSRCGESFNARTSFEHRCACDRRCNECGRRASRFVLDVELREDVPKCDTCVDRGKDSGTFRIAN
ncbi:hypothetical protein LVJ94_10650 [Pendulispora rubella]|uniref:C2H2-type domain-containing protein n=1 Tax=Pendulispora rubella TaxID=2741070 RepID=A0ABZ2LBE5_9BACT